MGPAIVKPMLELFYDISELISFTTNDLLARSLNATFYYTVLNWDNLERETN